MLHFSCKQDAAFRVPITPKACISSCSKGTAYHQCEALYIIKPQGKCTLARDEIQGRLAALDDIHRTSRGDDMPSLSAWIKKFDKSKLVEFFWPTRKDSNLRPSESESDALSSCATGRDELILPFATFNVGADTPSGCATGSFGKHSYYTILSAQMQAIFAVFALLFSKEKKNC